MEMYAISSILTAMVSVYVFYRWKKLGDVRIFSRVVFMLLLISACSMGINAIYSLVAQEGSYYVSEGGRSKFADLRRTIFRVVGFLNGPILLLSIVRYCESLFISRTTPPAK